MRKVEQESVDVRISGNKDVVERILRTLAYIHKSSSVGHSASFAIDVDGDGSDRVKIERIDGNPMPYFSPESRSGIRCEFARPSDVEKWR